MLKDEWPFDGAKYVFLLRAVDQLGTAMFAGAELDILQHGELIRSIRQRCCSEQMVGAWQRHDGDFVSLRAAKWQDDRCLNWFRTGKLSDADAYGHGGQYNRSDHPRHWVYLGREDVERVARSIAHESVPSPIRIGSLGHGPPVALDVPAPLLDWIQPTTNQPSLQDRIRLGEAWVKARAEAWQKGSERKMTLEKVVTQLHDQFELKSGIARKIYRDDKIVPKALRQRGRPKK